MHNIQCRYKVLLVVSGIVAAGILIEVFFSWARLVYGFRDPRFANKPEFVPNVVRVLCIGDSFTYGCGAAPEHCYPAVLERILKEKNNGKIFKVYNLGLPGSNSSQMLLNLKYQIKALKPHVVVALIGLNDGWNKRAAKPYGNLASFSMLLGRLKSWTFVEILKTHVRQRVLLFSTKEDRQVMPGAQTTKTDARDKALMEQAPGDEFFRQIERGNVFRSHREFDNAENSYKKALALAPANSQALLELGRCYKLAGQFEKALESLAAALENSGTDTTVYDEIDDVLILVNNPERAIAFFCALEKTGIRSRAFTLRLSRAHADAGLRLMRAETPSKRAEGHFLAALDYNPTNEQALSGLLTIAHHYAREYSLKKAEHCLRKVLRKNPDDVRIYLELACFAAAGGAIDNLLGYYSALYALVSRKKKNPAVLRELFDRDVSNSVMSANLIEIVALCEKAGSKLIFSSYPEYLPVSMIFTSKKHSVALVDQQEVFQRLSRETGYEKLFVSSSDRHCTAAGYRIVAENIAREILANSSDNER